MGMGPAGAIGGIGDIIGLIGGINQQNKMNQEVSGLSGNLNSILQLEGTTAGQLLQQYTGKTLPELQQMVSTLGPEQQGAFNQALGAFGNVGNVAGQFLTPGSTPSMSQMGNVAQELSKWSGLGNKEMGALQTQAGNAALSAANTMKQQMGGVANPGLVMQQMANQAGQTGQNAAVQLGSLAQQQQLGAREAAGQIYGQMTGDQIQKLQDAMSGYQAQGAGYSGLSGQALQGMLQSLGLQTSGMQTGAGMLNATGQQYGGWLGDMMGYQSQQGNPYANFLQNIAGLVPTGWGGGGGFQGGGGGGGGGFFGGGGK